MGYVNLCKERWNFSLLFEGRIVMNCINIYVESPSLYRCGLGGVYSPASTDSSSQVIDGRGRTK